MPTEIASDNFNRADNSSVGMNLGANWSSSTPQDDLGISSNQAYPTATSGDNVAFWSANKFFTDQYAQATIKATGATSYMGVIVRANASDYVLGQCDQASTDLAIYWYNGGTYTQIGSTYTSSGWATNDVAYLQVDGPNYTLKQNGTTRVTGSNNSAPKKGAPGICLTHSSDRMDDWSGGNLYDFGMLDFTAVEESPVSGTVDLSITIPTGYSNYGLIMATQSRDSTDSNRNITGITWNTSENFTQAKEQNDDTRDLTAEQWYLTNPTTGTHTASITYAGATSRTRAVLMVMAGMAQSSVVDITGGGSGTSGSPSTAVTTTVDNTIVIDSIFHKFESSPTPGTDQLGIDGTTVGSGADGVGTSYKRKSTAGSVTMSWTFTSDDYCMAVVAYKPYTSSATTYTKTFTADGIIKEVLTKTFTVDGIVINRETKIFTVDGQIIEVSSKTFTVDGIVLATQTQTFTVDGIITSGSTKSFTIDGLIVSRIYSLGSLVLPRPSAFSRSFINSWKDVISINGKTSRDTAGLKEKYVLSWSHLTKGQIDALLEIISANTPINFQVNDGNLQIASTSVIPFINDITYETQGGSYLSSTQLTLIEET